MNQLMTIALLGCAACGSSPGNSQPSVESANDVPDASGNGQFIIRVPPTGEVAQIDPILAPDGAAPHTHVFFGAEDVTPTSTRAQLLAGSTVADDQKDHSAYWVPQLYFRGQPWNPGCTGSPPNLTCDDTSSSTYYVRAYYTTVAGAATVQLPPIAMVTGYPDATQDPASDHPEAAMLRVRYTCGAEREKSIVTPSSTWPYTCSTFQNPFDGVVMIVEFPDCWSGHASGSLNGGLAVWYVDSNVEPGATNDLKYEEPSGNCPMGYPYRIPRVSIHVHTMIQNPASSDQAVILPSSCDGSTFPDCTTGTEPPPTGPGSIAIELSSDAKTRGGWYTFHGDYIQAWHMGKVDSLFSTSPPPDQDAQENPCTLNDLTEDCLLAATRCGFQPNDRTGVCVGN